MKVISERNINDKVLRLVKDDITGRNVDAIVNAANAHLQHGGGVAGAIVRAGGQVIQQESDEIAYTPVGTAVITSAGILKAKHVIHAVGPMMGEGDEDEKLRCAIRSVLELATSRSLQRIAVPAISSGIFGFPKDRCAQILVGETIGYLRENPESSLLLIEFCVLDDKTVAFFLDALRALK